MTCLSPNLDGATPSQTSSHPPKRRAETAPKPEVTKRKILVLEDDEAFRSFLKRLLLQEGFEVISVLNGVDGVHQVLAHDFDAILCDMVMPTLSGDMFYRAVERMRPHLCRRFIFVTGQYEQAKVKEFLANTGGTILLKPFQIEDLREMLAFIDLRNLHLAK
jgi:two-component system cell cycle sensor histidine kinase/response regulator CckA